MIIFNNLFSVKSFVSLRFSFVLFLGAGFMVGKEMLSLNLNFLGVTTVKKIILPFDEFSFVVGYPFYGAFCMSLKVIIFCIRWDHHFCSLLRIILQYVCTHHILSGIHSAITLSSLQCIASTTLDEYRLYFEKDTALARRFQPVWVDEPTEVVFHIHVYIIIC